MNDPADSIKPVGQCIYCGRRAVRLTDEHVIPYGLGGRLVLPKSSCKRCAKITGGVEHFVLRKMFSPLRTRLGILHRNKKEQRTHHIKAFKDSSDKFRYETVPIMQAPIVVMGLRLPLPGVLTGTAVADDVCPGEIWAKISDDAKAGMMASEGLYLGAVHPGNFARMISKIAYAYAVAVLGVKRFRPFLNDIIRGMSTNYFHYVGGYPNLSEPNLSDKPVIVRLHVPHGTNYVVADICLFPGLGTPQYVVVIGELNGPRNNIGI